MRSLVSNSSAVLILLAGAAYVPAQTAVSPGQIASASETPGTSFAAYASSSSLPLIPPKIEIANVGDKHDRTMNRMWLGSVFAMLGASGMDAATSWGKYEKNSFLASPDGKLGAKGLGFKAGIAGAVVIPQVLLRKRKDLRTKFAIANFAEAGVSTAIAIHNLGIPAPSKN